MRTFLKSYAYQTFRANVYFGGGCVNLTAFQVTKTMTRSKFLGQSGFDEKMEVSGAF